MKTKVNIVCNIICACDVDQSLSTVPARTVSTTVESSTGGECEMAAHSPARVGANPQHAPPPPYAQPPPSYPPPHQWPVAPPNVYVSQVTANVNVHGYMGQYYQPPQPQYQPGAAQQDRAARTHRRDRRTKRVPSPPHHSPYYQLQYPQYYPQQAQGAPLYHLPMYQPLVYGPYPYPPYYQEYPVPVEGEPDKAPEEYPPEVVMEQEAVDAYYANAHYAQPYGAPMDPGLEYAPPVYLPPPHGPPASAPLPHHYHHAAPQPHQFNVHAKNFVAGQGKQFVLQDSKAREVRSPPAAPSVSAVATDVESLPFRDLKIAGKGPASPKHNERAIDVPQNKVTTPPSDKPVQKTEPSKPSWSPPENKPEVNAVQPQANKSFVPPAPVVQTTGNKLPPTVAKQSKGPAAPFSSKQPAKPLVPQTIVPVQQAASAPKPPFGNRQKRDGPITRSPSGEAGEREQPLPPSKAPMPISITLPSAGQPLIVANKPPFGHSRKVQPEPPPAPQPPPPAPTASDFPPPPTPRNRGELPPPVPVAAPQPQPAPGKSWASLFSSKVSIFHILHLLLGRNDKKKDGRYKFKNTERLML